jgi:hypothetical protein
LENYQQSIVVGQSNEALGFKNMIIGRSNKSKNAYNHIFGALNTVDGANNTCIGINNDVDSVNSIVIGESNFTTDSNAIVIGSNNTVNNASFISSTPEQPLIIKTLIENLFIRSNVEDQISDNVSIDRFNKYFDINNTDPQTKKFIVNYITETCTVAGGIINGLSIPIKKIMHCSLVDDSYPNYIIDLFIKVDDRPNSTFSLGPDSKIHTDLVDGPYTIHYFYNGLPLNTLNRCCIIGSNVTCTNCSNVTVLGSIATEEFKDLKDMAIVPGINNRGINISKITKVDNPQITVADNDSIIYHSGNNVVNVTFGAVNPIGCIIEFYFILDIADVSSGNIIFATDHEVLKYDGTRFITISSMLINDKYISIFVNTFGGKFKFTKIDETYWIME